MGADLIGELEAGVPQPLRDDDAPAPAVAADASTVVIVGNGMVSHHLCERLVEDGGRLRPRIIVLGEESRPAYDRVRLGEMLGGRRASSLTLATPDWYRERDIELVLDDPVVAVDRKQRVAHTRSGREVKYDRLIFATGASPTVPDIARDDNADVFVIRTTGHLERLRERTGDAKRAAVIGGGLLGLETAKSLRDAGLEVHVIETSTQLMARQLDDEAAALLKAKLERKGINVVLGAQVRRIAKEEGTQRILFTPESARAPLVTDIVVISVGVQPRDELATACGLPRGKRGGIAVDRQLATEDPRVFAIGDCAAVDGITYGLVAPGYRMAEALSETLLGRPKLFEMPTAPVSLKVAGIEVTTIGETKRGAAHKTFRFRHNSVYRRVVVEDGRVIGATAVGGWTEIGAVQDAIVARRHLGLGWMKRFRREGKLWRLPVVGQPRDRADRVCACAGVSAGAVMDAIAAGCTTVDAVSRATGVARGCGSCLPTLSLMVGQPAPRRSVALPWMGGVAAMGLLAAALTVMRSPVLLAGALDRHGLERLFRDPLWQQVSGFTLLGASLLALLLPLVKRALRVGGGVLPAWRVAHAGIGLGALGALVIHTSLRAGHRLNLALELAFVALLFLGATAGIFGADRGGPIGRALRLAHIFVFWPLLSLIGLHVLAVYYF